MSRIMPWKYAGRVWAAVLSVPLLGCGRATTAPNPPIPVEQLSGWFCDVTRLPEDVVLQGRLQWEQVTCLEQDVAGFCLRCESTPMLTGMGDEGLGAPFRLAPMRWSAPVVPSEGLDCVSQPPHPPGQPHRLRVKLPDDFPAILLSGAPGVMPAVIPVQPLEPLRPVSTDDPSGALAVERVFEAVCALPSTPVRLMGTVQPGPGTTCTKVYCPGECCNTCDSQAVLVGSSMQVALEGVQCRGTNCGMTCPGFSPGTKYEITGVLRREQFWLTLSVQDSQVVEEPPWGEVVGGLQAQLSGSSAAWDLDGPLPLTFELRNVSDATQTLRMGLCGRVSWTDYITVHVQPEGSAETLTFNVSERFDTMDFHPHYPLIIPPDRPVEIQGIQVQAVWRHDFLLDTLPGMPEFLKTLRPPRRLTVWATLAGISSNRLTLTVRRAPWWARLRLSRSAR